MTVFALDLGTNMGWASSGNASGVVRHGSDDRRYLRFVRWLAQHVRKGDVVYYEDVRRHAGTTAAHVYGGFLAVLKAYCEENGATYRGVGVGTIKRHWTGKGNAKKDAMVAEAKRRGFLPKDDNEADALALLDYALNEVRFAPEAEACLAELDPALNRLLD